MKFRFFKRKQDGEITQVLRESGWFVDSPPAWLLDGMQLLLSESEHGEKVALITLRSKGQALTSEEKKALGVRGNAKLGSEYIATLSELGKTRSLDAIEVCFHRLRHARYVAREIAQLKANTFVTRIQVLSADDERTCVAARGINLKIFNKRDFPSLPLPECDAAWCRCVYVGLVDE